MFFCNGHMPRSAHLHTWIGLIHLVASSVSVWFPWRWRRAPWTVEYCLTKSMRPYPLTLATVIPFSGLSVAAQSEQCGWRDRTSSCFYTEIVRSRRRRRKREGWQSFHGFLLLLFCVPLLFPSPPLCSAYKTSLTFSACCLSLFPPPPVCTELPKKASVGWARLTVHARYPARRHDAQCICRHTSGCRFLLRMQKPSSFWWPLMISASAAVSIVSMQILRWLNSGHGRDKVPRSWQMCLLPYVYTTVQTFGITQTISCLPWKITLLFIKWI